MTRAPHLPMGEGREFDAIRAMLAGWGGRAEGIGDDAAVLELPANEKLVVSTDASVEHVHFRREWLAPREIGARAATAALSDLAAMGATPRGLLLALTVPDSWRDDLAALAAGVGDSAGAAECPIVGGNLSRGSELSLTITVLGSAARPLPRDGATAGDIMFVTGLLGGPGAALAALDAGAQPADEHRARFASPHARLAEGRWCAEQGATAAIDISDGLLSDAGHLARASGVSLELDAGCIPRVPGVTAEQALASGEEYELLLAFPRDAQPDTAAFASRFGVPLTAIGEAREGSGARILRAARVDLPRGHDHFS